ADTIERMRAWRNASGMLCAIFALGLAVVAGAAAPELPGAATILDHVRALAADTMEGRQAGTPGAELAAEYISRAFQDAGLQPAGDAGTFRQTFSVPTGIRLGAPTALTVAANPPRSLTLGSEFAPLAVSDDGLRTGEIVFVGYGITAPD